MNGNPRFLNLLEQMKAIHMQKSAGYAGIDNPDTWANFRESEKIGVPAWKGCLVRLLDKVIRMENVIKNPLNEQVGEDVTQTLIDLSSHSLIAICLLEELREKKNADNSDR